jgi:hypothetical protein
MKARAICMHITFRLRSAGSRFTLGCAEDPKVDREDKEHLQGLLRGRRITPSPVDIQRTGSANPPCWFHPATVFPDKI